MCFQRLFEKGHGFSRAATWTQDVPALAAEGRIECIQTIRQGLKPRCFSIVSGTAKAVPFQISCHSQLKDFMRLAYSNRACR